MKTIILIAIIASALVAHAGDQPPVVIPVQGGVTATTSKFGDGYITRTSSGQTYTTSQFGSGTITRDSKGNTWTTSKFGDGAITRGPDGQTVTTSIFGSGYISRDNQRSCAATGLPACQSPRG